MKIALLKSLGDNLSGIKELPNHFSIEKIYKFLYELNLFILIVLKWIGKISYII